MLTVNLDTVLDAFAKHRSLLLFRYEGYRRLSTTIQIRHYDGEPVYPPNALLRVEQSSSRSKKVCWLPK